MKKAFLISAIFSLLSGTASAAVPTNELTCPSAFPYFVVAKISPLATNSYAVAFGNPTTNEILNIGYMTVASNSAINAQTRSLLIAPDLTTVWKQGKPIKQAQYPFANSSSFNIYYCAYTSKKYTLSTKRPDKLIAPQEAAYDYILVPKK